MEKVMKTVEVESKEVKSITEDQLKAIQDHQSKVSAILLDVGFLESKKMEVLGLYTEASKEMNETKAELEKEYGAVNIDLKDGSYTVIEEEAVEK
jgi:hypothetical protein